LFSMKRSALARVWSSSSSAKVTPESDALASSIRKIYGVDAEYGLDSLARNGVRILNVARDKTNSGTFLLFEETMSYFLDHAKFYALSSQTQKGQVQT
jgi:hypothetical protein